MSTRYRQRYYRLSPPPPSLARIPKDNLALVPGNMLPYREVWQRLANRLPQDAVLILVPNRRSRQGQTMLTIARLLANDGRQVRVVPADEVRRRARRTTVKKP